MKTYRVRVHKETSGILEVDAEDEQDALNKADDILTRSEEPLSTWGRESAEAEEVLP